MVFFLLASPSFLPAGLRVCVHRSLKARKREGNYPKPSLVSMREALSGLSGWVLERSRAGLNFRPHSSPPCLLPFSRTSERPFNLVCWRNGGLLKEEKGGGEGVGAQEGRTHTTEAWPEKEVGSWGARGWRSPTWEAITAAWTLSSAPGMWTAHRWVWKWLIELLCACESAGHWAFFLS